MLYVTTRNNLQADTPRRMLQAPALEDGGMYLPLKGPRFSREELAGLSPNGCVALVLNRLFRENLTAYDVDFAIGRHFLRVRELPGKLLAGECWHNVEGHVIGAVRGLNRRLLGREPVENSWAEVAIRAALIFGLLAGREKTDLSLSAGDFTWPMAAWYARQWGAPVGEIVICCREESSIWELFRQGELRTDQFPIPGEEPDGVTPWGLERLIWECGGVAAVEGWRKACYSGRIYTPERRLLQKMTQGFTVSVIGDQRLENTVFGVNASWGYPLSGQGALVYAGLQDHRTRTEQREWAMMVLDREPRSLQEMLQRLCVPAPEGL